MEDVLIEKVRLLWISCEEALEDMDVLYDHKRYRACVGRAYYAMFYGASAFGVDLCQIGDGWEMDKDE